MLESCNEKKGNELFKFRNSKLEKINANVVRSLFACNLMFLFVKGANYTKRVCVVVYETKHSQGFTLTLSSLHVDYSCLFYFQLRKKYRKEKKKMVLLSRTIQHFSVEIKKLLQCDSCL